MPKADRYFEIIQILRRADRPVLAAEIAETLEVSRRTIYRDIAALQAMQTPIMGEAGIGYVMRSGYDLPPINFDTDEAEAIAVGLQMVAPTGDESLWRAARRASRKLNETVPWSRRLVASSWAIDGLDPTMMTKLRSAIRDECKLSITYGDAKGDQTSRVIWPLALVYYWDTGVLAAWCETRNDFRHFRLDRLSNVTATDDSFAGRGKTLFDQWDAHEKTKIVTTRIL